MFNFLHVHLKKFHIPPVKHELETERMLKVVNVSLKLFLSIEADW